MSPSSSGIPGASARRARASPRSAPISSSTPARSSPPRHSRPGRTAAHGFHARAARGWHRPAKPETADYLAKARAALSDAQQIAALPLPHIAAREAYIAVFHAAEACIFEQIGKAARTHRGVRSEFARLAQAEPRIGRDLVTFLAAAYQFKMRADCAVGPADAPISVAEATAALATAARFIGTVAQPLPQTPEAK